MLSVHTIQSYIILPILNEIMYTKTRLRITLTDFSSVKLPKSFVAINLSEKVPDAFGRGKGKEKDVEVDKDKDVEEAVLPPPALSN